ncbi:nucleotidyltransferase domain-containing protein [Methylobacterium sp. XJLW]|uniref:nucleotidyltransferase domain-containing protein n=1 Tax=Methylobacterium sp. XJLW TaxID=739141 RepID=UPI000DAD565E|nr:amino acid transporter [Methylobacterium sp. XJLW]
MNPPDENAWDAWSPHELAQRLRGAIVPWYVAGGWALDIWHGKRTRVHEDLEFAVLRHDADHFRNILHELDFFTAKDGEIEYLSPTVPVPSDVWQVWGADKRRGVWRVDLMIEQGTPNLWVYKRNETIKMARSDAVRVSEEGIPYLAPEIVVLFKAKHCRDKDQADFELCLPKFSAGEKEKLVIWLNNLHPNHEWLTPLQTELPGSL